MSAIQTEAFSDNVSIKIPQVLIDQSINISIYEDTELIKSERVKTSPLDLSDLDPEKIYKFKLCLVSNPDSCESFSFKTLKAATLLPVYPGNENWNQYVRNNGADKYNADNTACDGTETGDYFLNMCLHGGELRTVTSNDLIGQSCNDFSVSDELDAFDWICRDGSGAVVFYSVSLKKSKKLADLLSADGFYKNRVKIKKNNQLYMTSNLSNEWWSNPVKALPSGSGDLDTPSAIYVLEQSRTDNTHNITASGVSIVTKGQALHSSTSISFIASLQKFLWVEGNFGGQTDTVFDFSEIHFSQFRNLRLADIATGKGLRLFRGDYNYVDNVTANNVLMDAPVYLLGFSTNTYTELRNIKVSNSAQGIHLTNSQYVIIDNYQGFKVTSHIEGTSDSFDVRITNSTLDFGSYGIHTNINNSVVSGVRLSNFTNDAIRGFGANLKNTIFTNIVIMSSADGQHNSLYDDGNTFHNITSLMNSRYYETWRSSNNVFTTHAIINNGTNFHIRGSSTDSTFHIFANNAISGAFNIADPNNRDHSFIDYLLKDTTVNCNIDPGAGPNTGLQDTTCANQGTSTATHRSGLDFSGSLVGEVISDSINQYNNIGFASYDDMTQVNQFESIYRGWGKQGTSVMDPTAQGACLTTQTCQLWDARISASSSVIRNTTGDGMNQNEAFVAGSACPTAVDGNRVISDYSGNTYLINAIEIISDQVGDNDGLCESGEDCIYAPNYGAYQGEGNYLTAGTCNFSDGTISGVNLYAYPIREIN